MTDEEFNQKFRKAIEPVLKAFKETQGQRTAEINEAIKNSDSTVDSVAQMLMIQNIATTELVMNALKASLHEMLVDDNA